MIEQIEKEIQELLDSKITSYRIRQETGIAQQVIDRYRKKESKIENMTLKNAKKLINFKKSL
jgi:hypothetical protein